ncbi:MAG: amidotransferase 1, exosortase A system-associated [Propionivibrio sp.]|uniref:XrtA/PEP-CTERM system amidotransferase n=1 Tax=Propionivibrio sp. TaxID=2212460 RepID=UPI0025CEC620|nr:XrtA/PEP-CTERM system amidotransferase [Propionivibrio sp.]MBK8893863.1 amidotransferase 1, exosortase A system-associated [Propionivibrio sp.]
MCGITGIFDTRGKRDIDRSVLTRMNESQHHRGPDEGGLHIEAGVGLGHRRLSIIDLSTGQQPLYNEDQSVCVVFNGEIYNFQELIPELQVLGHVFHTRSDTEVIVHAWESWGEKCVERFRGMFAFALWDRNLQTLFLARDRLGVKPLYYALLPDGIFLFGSELKSVLAHGGLQREIDPFAVEEYFALGYVAEPRSIFKAAKKLPPAHTLTLRRGQGMPSPVEYWDVHFSLDVQLTESDACQQLEERLNESIRLRMISEVPLGAFLSGGVDSSAVVAMMAGLSAGPVNTCSIAFSDPAYNEAEFAKAVASRYHTNHHVELVESDDFDLIDTLARLYDEPYADSSAIPTYRVCQLARKHVTVALSGDGGDETFGGYRRYRLHLVEEKMRSVMPLGLRRPLFGALGRWYPKADWAPRVFRGKTTFEALARSSVEAYFHTMSLIREPMRSKLYSHAFKSDLGGYSAIQVFQDHAERANTDDPLALIQYIDTHTYLVGDINTKVDRASMAHSLEVREPLMDHRLVEWLATLPSSMKMRGGESKFLLKKAMEPHLPRDIMYRPKMGFAVPLDRWFRGPLRQRVRDTLLNGRIAESGMFNPATVHQILEQHDSRARDHSTPIWTLLMFDAFLRCVLDGQESRESRILEDTTR